MDTSPQFEKFPNPNPNLGHQFPYATHHQHNDLLYFRDISNYLMSDEGLDGKALLQAQGVLGNTIMSFSDESSISTLSACNIKCGSKVKKYKTHKDFRFEFRTKSDLEFMDDGFKWRKYGKKVVKSSPNPRNYFKCSSGGCNVKKRVERDREDSSYVITTYEGIHNHETPTPCVVYRTPKPHSLSHASFI
ncbi:hypothetical protein CDL12_00364 [Handroanthus impetiginosus]|uniref:WRKY domain-containing protein n=1 Tax=Handroanthus impetiginosus TaxID=429701 RepID=A0A2G9IAU3_9LAMI|nr:hypothetical protein CDL12_00364 [Handroanthus impetiginosus]